MSHTHSHSHTHSPKPTDHPDIALLKGPEEEPSEEESIKMEAEHYGGVVAAMANYKDDSYTFIRRLELQFLSLSRDHKKLLAHWKDKFVLYKQAIRENSQFLDTIVTASEQVFVNQSEHLSEAHESVSHDHVATRHDDIDKLRTSLKQCVRDWSSVGNEERAMCYQPIIDAVNGFFTDSTKRKDVSVLVPGCGLGRLAWEFAHAGYRSQGNEFSFFMLLMSHFILNRSPGVESITLFPYVTTSMNVYASKDPLKAVKIPDVDPASLPPDSQFSMTAGDFLDVYGDDEHIGQWDCVVTCFFVDTAHNIIEYVETIHKILKKGGLWVNLGPMLFHYADMPGVRSLEMSVEDLMGIVKALGFQVLRENRQECIYTPNYKSMLRHVYDCQFFSAVKV